jgi:hypothetical protein
MVILLLLFLFLILILIFIFLIDFLPSQTRRHSIPP